MYEHLCIGGFNEGAVEEDNQVHSAKQLASSAIETAAETTAEMEQGKKEKNNG